MPEYTFLSFLRPPYARRERILHLQAWIEVDIATPECWQCGQALPCGLSGHKVTGPRLSLRHSGEEVDAVDMDQGWQTPFGTGDKQRGVLHLLARTRSTGESQVDLMDALPFDWGRHAVMYDGSVSLAAVRVRTWIFIREEARIHVPRIFPASVCATGTTSSFTSSE